MGCSTFKPKNGIEYLDSAYLSEMLRDMPESSHQGSGLPRRVFDHLRFWIVPLFRASLRSLGLS